MANTAYITITSSGQQLTFTPADLKITYDSLAGEDSGRTDDGTMHIDWKLRKIPKLEITLPPHAVTDTKYNKILSYVQGQIYTINYYDYLAGERRNLSVYTSSTQFSWYSGVILDGMVTGESFSAIAMQGESNIPHAQQLDTPVLRRSGAGRGGNLIWDSIENAEEYHIIVHSTLYPVDITTVNTTYIFPDLTTSYTIDVKAIAEGYIDSEWATYQFNPITD